MIILGVIYNQFRLYIVKGLMNGVTHSLNIRYSVSSITRLVLEGCILEENKDAIYIKNDKKIICFEITLNEIPNAVLCFVFILNEPEVL